MYVDLATICLLLCNGHPVFPGWDLATTNIKPASSWKGALTVIMTLVLLETLSVTHGLSSLLNEQS